MTARLYIERLPSRFDEDDLLDLCEPYGEVSEVQILGEDFESKGSGSATVDYEDLDDAHRAADEVDGHELDEQRLKVTYSSRKRSLSSYE